MNQIEDKLEARDYYDERINILYRGSGFGDDILERLITWEQDTNSEYDSLGAKNVFSVCRKNPAVLAGPGSS